MGLQQLTDRTSGLGVVSGLCCDVDALMGALALGTVVVRVPCTMATDPGANMAAGCCPVSMTTVPPGMAAMMALMLVAC